MAFSCSQCNFTAQFESALLMHRQLHHDSPGRDDYPELAFNVAKGKSKTLPNISPGTTPLSSTMYKGLKPHSAPPARSSSATRLLGKLKARICKSRTLFAHPEETGESAVNVKSRLSPSECAPKVMKTEAGVSRTSDVTACSEDRKETFGCHLCPFEADRITSLDRHLLSHHKIGLENLLQLVMAKTRDGLSGDQNSLVYGIKQPYYRTQDVMIEDGEFIIETVTPKIKILRHAATNTDEDNSPKDLSLEKNCQMISTEIESMLNRGTFENDEFLSKMKTLNDYMCKFVDSSNALKKVVHNEFDTKTEKQNLNGDEPFFDLRLGEDTPRNWERSHSENMERSRNKYGESCRADKVKQSAESFYF